MIEYRILIPVLRDSDRKPHGVVAWKRFEEYLVSLFNGFTERQSVRGQWRSDESGRIIDDMSVEYAFSTCVESKLSLVIAYVKREFDQQAIYIGISHAEIL